MGSAATNVHLPAGPLLGAARSPGCYAALAFVALLCGRMLCLAVGLAFPISDEQPGPLLAALLVLSAVLATVTYVLRRRVASWFLLGQAVLCVSLNSVVVAQAHAAGGAVVVGFSSLWLTVYTATFFPRAWLPFTTLVAGGFGVGLLAGGLPGMVVPWLVLTLSSFTAGAVLSHISLAVRARLETDVLTGALNRDGLTAAAHRARGRRRGRIDGIVVAALDLDGFKQINDRRGHLAGDRLLAEAAQAWRGALRGADVLARTGGDEFVLVLPNTSHDEAALVLDRLRAAHPVTWSVGIATWAADEALTACLERADQRLYAAKPARRARIAALAARGLQPSPA
jgi:diguanylate cyclase (GGDEF)-like protein